MLLAGLVWMLSATNTALADTAPFAIAIHGGAGTIDRDKLQGELRQRYETKLLEALDAGYRLLDQGESSQAAVIAAIQVLEDSPLFNAGKGAVYTYEGRHELDASLMDGATLQAGAVAGVKTVSSPIALAKAVMDNSPHVLLSGEGAEAFAAEQGFTPVSNDYFDTEDRYQSLLRAKQKLEQEQDASKDFRASYEDLPERYRMGTVGAVALDQQGNLAAGTSTGGMTAKRFGRVGDSPIIGAGTYADNTSCAVSATGHGEYFIRYHVAADICARVKYQGASLADASDTVINQVLKDAGGSGGIIAMDPSGNIAMPFNTVGMYRASRSSDGSRQVAIFE
ncbi:isoaspartyl peptidase/L-asparaginase [Seongchinamella sediminis]|uniref:Isoaspartyl peptidase n=2 Tax=Seongchinamella sediminis TaxID=2283635 RepID=A0A3L7E137_9GAMM|nr:isoaspartyl peptidase/L-asparaginase [Seongchinamella sediminis]